MRLSGTKATAIHQYRGLGSQLWDLAGVRPSLDLPFADQKSLVDATTGSNLVDFTRASSATYVDGDGLIKTATTNLLLQSEDFSTTWLGTAAVTTNTADSPFGELSADTLTYNSVESKRYQNVTTASSTTYTFSVWMRATTGTFELKLSRTNGVSWSGATVSAPITLTTTWQRYSLTFTTGMSDTLSGLVIGNENLTAYTLPATGSIYIWGAQLEQSSTVGEYIPTTSTINSAPRFDHDPTTGESLGLLVEESRTNLALRSSELTATSIWVRTGVSFDANAATAPDGSTDADKMIAGTAPSEQRIRDDIGSLSSNASYTLSIFAKAAGYNYLVINHGDYLVADYNTWFDLATGTVETNPAGSTAKIEDVGNGWYRCSVTRTTTATQNTISARFLVSNADNVTSFTGNGTSGIYIWGAQLEQSSYATSYIPTTGSTATRAADVSTSAATTVFESDWYRQDEGTVFTSFNLDTNRSYTGTFRHLLHITLTANNNSSVGVLVDSSGRYQLQVRDNNSNVATPFTSTNAGETSLVAAVYKVDDFAIAANGEAPATDNSGAAPTTDSPEQMVIGGVRDGNTLGILNGTIRRLTYWPTRLPNEVLQTITL